MRAPEQSGPAELLADVLWGRPDRTGLEHCRVTRSPGFVSILGCVLTIEGGLPYRVDYRVRCDPDWTTSAVSIQTIRGPTRSRLELARIEPGVWMADGRRIPGIEGLVDVDLAITPATN